MRTLLLLSSGLLVAVAAAERTLHAPLAISPFKRDLMTCEQTYGAGALPCGDASHSMCYNPTEGQTCCASDHGYCDKGKYCSPVAGYCCLEDEDLPSCAKNAGFVLPAMLASTPAAPSAPAATEITTTAIIMATAAPKPSASASAPAPPSKNGGKNGTTPYVHVSVARKEQWTILYMSLGIGVVGVIMAMF